MLYKTVRGLFIGNPEWYIIVDFIDEQKGTIIKTNHPARKLGYSSGWSSYTRTNIWEPYHMKIKYNKDIK